MHWGREREIFQYFNFPSRW